MKISSADRCIREISKILKETLQEVFIQECCNGIVQNNCIGKSLPSSSVHTLERNFSDLLKTFHEATLVIFFNLFLSEFVIVVLFVFYFLIISWFLFMYGIKGKAKCNDQKYMECWFNWYFFGTNFMLLFRWNNHTFKVFIFLHFIAYFVFQCNITIYVNNLELIAKWYRF